MHDVRGDVKPAGRTRQESLAEITDTIHHLCVDVFLLHVSNRMVRPTLFSLSR